MSRLNAALSSAIQHAMPPEFGRKWGTECLNISFPLPTLLCAGYSVKPISYFGPLVSHVSYPTLNYIYFTTRARLWVKLVFVFTK